LLGTDAFGDATYAAIEEHVEGCPNCKAILEQLASGGHELPVFLPDLEQWPQIPGFEIQRELGRGAMSVVYEAWQPSLKRRVALKIVRSGPFSGSSERSRWLREARAFTCLRHANIVPLHEAGEAGPWLYLVLEHIPGGTLKHRLDVPYAARDAAGLLETIARAVAAVHAKGLLHLDLKPSNILLDVEPEKPRELATPRIGDFGIAFRWNDPDASMATGSQSGPLGTPSYMPPEQVAGDRAAIGPAADIYGLGALLYHVLTGRPPFSSPSVAETLDQVRNQEPVSPRRLIPQVPRDLETIALKCLEKNPSARYASAESVADDLRRWLDGRPIAARPISPLEKIWRWCRRRPVIAALTAALALTLSVGFLIVVLLWRHAETERGRAEDDLRFAGLMLSEITSLDHPHWRHFLVLAPDDVFEVLQRTRDHILHVQTQHPDDFTACHQLAQIDLSRAWHFAAQGKLDESRASIVECLKNLERVLQLHPQDWTALRRRFIAHWTLGSVVDQEGKSEESLSHLERAVLHGQECLRLKPDAGLISELAGCRWSVAQSLSRQGNHERARFLILANLRMLDDVPKDDGHPIIAIWRTLVRLDLHQVQAHSSSVLASQSDEADPLSRLASSEANTLDSESWAELVARSLSSGPAAIDLSGNNVYIFIDHLFHRIAEQRRAGRINEARRAADRIHAFARLLVQRYPDRSVAHLALCASFIQMAKNAWQTDDRLAVERNWKLALDEAHRALLLDPHDARACTQVVDLQKRIDRLLASKPEPRDQNRSAQTAGEAGR